MTGTINTKTSLSQENTGTETAHASSEPCIAVAICDDDPVHLRSLEVLTDRCLIGTRHRIYSYTDSSDLLEDLPDRMFFLILMDIQLKGENGILVSQKIHAKNPYCNIIFVTSFLSYAQDVYDVKHIAFVNKPDMEFYLPRAIDRLLHQTEETTADTITIHSGSSYQIVPLSDIVYMERVGRKVAIYVSNSSDLDQVLTKEKLEDILVRLDDSRFVQCHKSYAINWEYVKNYSRDSILLKNGVTLPISRNRMAGVMEAFQKWSFR